MRSSLLLFERYLAFSLNVTETSYRALHSLIKKRIIEYVQTLYLVSVNLNMVTEIVSLGKMTWREVKEWFGVKSTDFLVCFRPRREVSWVINRLSIRATVIGKSVRYQFTP